ncbi:alpha/beta fold hydrolase [Paraburkholderia sp. J69-1]|nr:alpha/beta fold hydrolase [Paraburkholderia sp. J69-1]
MSDGVELSVSEIAGHNTTKGTIVLVHGTGMHGAHYTSFARLLAQMGARVMLVDMRGHGRSGGVRGHSAHRNQYADDLVRCFNWFAAERSGPLVLLAHSGGAVTLLRALARSGIAPAGVALIAPTLANDTVFVRRDIGGRRHREARRLPVRTAPAREVRDDGRAAMRFSPRGFFDGITRLNRFAAAMTCAPSMPGEAPFAYTANGLMASMLKETEVWFESIACPVLLVTGESDVFVNDASIHTILPWAFAAEVALTSCSIPGADHYTVLLHALRPFRSWLDGITSGGGTQ